MKNLPLIFACLGSGIAGAAALDLLTPSEQHATANQEEALIALREEFASTQAAGRAEREALERRLALMEGEARMVSPTQARGLVPEQGSKNISDDNLPALASNEAIRIGNAVIPPEQFEAWVQRASDSIEERKQMERDQERLIREGERIEEQIAKLTTDLGLDQRQQSEFRRYLQDTGTQRRDLFQSMRDGNVDRAAMRESMDKLREENDADLRTFLTEQQFTTYKESGADNPFGRGGPGGQGGGQRNNRGAGGTNSSGGAPAAGGGRGGNRGQGN